MNIEEDTEIDTTEDDTKIATIENDTDLADTEVTIVTINSS